MKNPILLECDPAKENVGSHQLTAADDLFQASLTTRDESRELNPNGWILETSS